MKEPIKLAIAEDHDLLRNGLVSILGSESKFEIVFEAKNGNEVMERLTNSKPSVILLDLDMPKMSGTEVLKRIKVEYPDVKAVMLSMHDSREYILQCISLGARGFLAKNTNVEKIIEAMENVDRYGFHINDDKSMSFLIANVKNSTLHENLKQDFFNGFSLDDLKDKYSIGIKELKGIWSSMQNNLSARMIPKS